MTLIYKINPVESFHSKCLSGDLCSSTQHDSRPNDGSKSNSAFAFVLVTSGLKSSVRTVMTPGASFWQKPGPTVFENDGFAAVLLGVQSGGGDGGS